MKTVLFMNSCFKKNLAENVPNHIQRFVTVTGTIIDGLAPKRCFPRFIHGNKDCR